MTETTMDPEMLGLDDVAIRNLLAVIADNAFESVMITTAEPNTSGPPILYVNDAFRALTGYEPKEVIGKTPGLLQGPGTEPTVIDWLGQNLATGRPFYGKAVNYRRDWSAFVMEWKIFPVRDDADEISHYVALQREAGTSVPAQERETVPAGKAGGEANSVTPRGEKSMIAKIDIGISEDLRRAIAEGLSHLLADSYTLYLKTHGFHWNVTGPLFNTLHLMFEDQYVELATAVDTIAERIRALGLPAPGSFAQFAELASIREETGVLSAEEMIRQLVRDQEAVVRTARSIFPLVEEAHDEPTADLLTQRMQVHEKTAWMLRSLTA